MSALEANRAPEWVRRLERRRACLRRPELVVEGSLRRLVGLTLEAEGCVAPVGSRCLIRNTDGREVEAEVVGFAGERLYLMPTGDLYGLTPNAGRRCRAGRTGTAGQSAGRQRSPAGRARAAGGRSADAAGGAAG